MTLGYTRPLYLLPFDHRHSYVDAMFHLTPPLSSDEHAAVANSKQVIYDGFRAALGPELPVAAAGILVDEEFGTDILRDAAWNGYVTALPVEKSGSAEFEFEYGEAFAQHIETFRPTFAKALVRYNPEGDSRLNERQTTRLKQLSDYCRAVDQAFMLELLVPPTDAQRQAAQADEATYDLRMRPALVLDAIRTLQDVGIEPDIWKVEGIDRREDCQRVVAAARRGGRDEVSCIVLGRRADDRRVVAWLEVAASVPGFVGFAVGRTTFWDPVADYVSRKVPRQDAASRIAHRYRQWVAIFERARQSRASAAA